MTIFRQYIAPLLIVLVFLVALLAVSSRIFLPNDLAAPAPIEDTDAVNSQQIPGNPAISSSLVNESARVVVNYSVNTVV